MAKRTPKPRPGNVVAVYSRLGAKPDVPAFIDTAVLEAAVRSGAVVRDDGVVFVADDNGNWIKTGETVDVAAVPTVLVIGKTRYVCKYRAGEHGLRYPPLPKD